MILCELCTNCIPFNRKSSLVIPCFNDHLKDFQTSSPYVYSIWRVSGKPHDSHTRDYMNFKRLRLKNSLKLCNLFDETRCAHAMAKSLQTGTILEAY